MSQAIIQRQPLDKNINGPNVERRTKRRRTLRKQTKVSLSRRDSESSWHCEGLMLNLSERGLACRVAKADFPEEHDGARIVVGFSLDDRAAGFDLPAQIVNVTEAGTPAFLVVGLEFLEIDESVESYVELQRILQEQSKAS